MKILIAEGSQEVGERLLNLMREIPGLELLTPTATAQATLQSIRAYNPEILIVDARLPGARAADLYRTIRRESPDIILIVLSNVVFSQSRMRYEAAGADFFLDKSSDFIRLTQLVRELVRHRQSEGSRNLKERVRQRLALPKFKVGVQVALFAFSASSHLVKS
jgi:DNA-binding NarL/FixJ family response regulator